MTEKQESGKKLLDVLGVRIELPRLTGIGGELLSIMQLPLDQIEIPRVVLLVESDPSLTVEVLHTANSVYFSALREVKTVSQAIPRMGLENTIHILSHHCMGMLMSVAKSLPNFSTKEFWLHSLATATVARMLGKPQYLLHSLPGELYTAGLLHDIGKIVLASYAGDMFNQACTIAREQSIPLHQAEMQVMGLDHAKVGGQVLDAWKLPLPILNAVRGHHELLQDKPEGREIAKLVELSDAIAYHCGFADGTGQPPPDLMQTIIIKDGKGQITEPKILQRVLEDAKVTLADKMKMHQKKEDKPSQVPADEKIMSASPQIVQGYDTPYTMPQEQPVQRSGFLGWLPRWVRNLFSAN
jgi:putative nucleotidyltransferase with HDIG domain